MAKQWTNVGSITAWNGKDKDVLVYKEGGKVAIGFVEPGSFDNPFITDTFIINSDQFTIMVKQMANIALDGQVAEKMSAVTPVTDKSDKDF